MGVTLWNDGFNPAEGAGGKWLGARMCNKQAKDSGVCSLWLRFPVNHITAGRLCLFRVTGVMTVYCLADEKKKKTERWSSPHVCMLLHCGEVLSSDFCSLAKRHIIINVSSLLCLYPLQAIALPRDHALKAGTVSNVFSSFLFFFPSGSWLKWRSAIHSSSRYRELLTLKVSRTLPPMGPGGPDTWFHEFPHSCSKNGLSSLPPVTG